MAKKTGNKPGPKTVNVDCHKREDGKVNVDRHKKSKPKPKK